MMSASRPASSRPRSSTPISSAATVVAARDRLGRGHAPFDQGDELLGVAAVGDGRGVGSTGDPRPALDGLGRSSAWPGGTPRPPWPATRVRRGTRPSRRPGRWWRPGRCPVRSCRSNVSSLISDPCSMQSMPHSTATRMASSPWQWAATLRPARWASSTMASSSSVGVLAGAGRAGMGHHPSRGADLDQPGAVLDLVPDGLADLGHAVGDALLHRQRQDVRRQGLEHGGVEVPPGRG